MKYNGKKVYFDKKGYALIWINGKDNKVHILEWEKYNGKKLEGHEIHHKDNNKKNWDIGNLTLETKSDHRKIHAGWVRNDGVWIKKPCKDCKQLLRLNEFYQRKGLTPSNRCINCSLIYFKKIGSKISFKKKRKKYMEKYYKKNKHEKWGIKN